MTSNFHHFYAYLFKNSCLKLASNLESDFFHECVWNEHTFSATVKRIPTPESRLNRMALYRIIIRSSMSNDHICCCMKSDTIEYIVCWISCQYICLKKTSTESIWKKFYANLESRKSILNNTILMCWWAYSKTRKQNIKFSFITEKAL